MSWRPGGQRPPVYPSYTHVMAATTIKISTELRDQLNAEARRRGTTAGSLVEALWEDLLRERRFAAIRQAMATADPEDLASYAEETAALDHLAGDGLPR